VRYPSLYFSYDAHLDWLMCFEFGRTDDGCHPEAWLGVTDEFGYLLDRPGGRVVGFKVIDFSEFDADAVSGIWSAPLFHCPTLGVRRASAGEICLAGGAQLNGSTLNRVLFQLAVGQSGEEAADLWRQVLEAGDVMGHFGLGYTLLELGDWHGAYNHLRAYTEITRYSPWGWNYRGQVCEGMGEVAEARRCYRRAIRLEGLQGESTDARERLVALRPSQN
jgi:tetratricopeptide (TPR) repeat protein